MFGLKLGVIMPSREHLAIFRDFYDSGKGIERQPGAGRVGRVLVATGI